MSTGIASKVHHTPSVYAVSAKSGTITPFTNYQIDQVVARQVDSLVSLSLRFKNNGGDITAVTAIGTLAGVALPVDRDQIPGALSCDDATQPFPVQCYLGSDGLIRINTCDDPIDGTNFYYLSFTYFV